MLYLLNYSFLLPVVVILLYNGRKKPTTFTAIILIYLLCLFVLNLYYEETRKILSKKLYYFIYTSIEYLSFTFIIWHLINSKTYKKILLLCSVFFLIFLVFFYSTTKIKRMDSIPVGIESLLLFIFIIFFFIEYFKNMYSSLLGNPSFWFIAGILIYLSITFFFNILVNNLDNIAHQQYYFYSYLGDILKNILFSFALFSHLKQKNIADSQLKNTHIPFLDIDTR